MKKERYELHIYDDCFVDCYNNGVLDKSIRTVYDVEQLLNQQDARIKELEEENQQLKEEIRQLKFDCAMFKSANYLINHFGIDKAREIMFQSEQKLKQSQNQKAIEVLRCVKDNLLDISSPYWQYFTKTGNAFMTYEDIEQWVKEYIDNQIKQLKAEAKKR